jgi:hypothetical protein
VDRFGAGGVMICACSSCGSGFPTLRASNDSQIRSSSLARATAWVRLRAASLR